MEIDHGCGPCVASAAFLFKMEMGVVFVHCLDAATHTEMVLIWSWELMESQEIWFSNAVGTLVF